MDKLNYRQWLFKAVQKYKLVVLNYTITNNHVHLLLLDTGDDVIPSSMCYIASHFAYQYNYRKKLPGGSFWQDRYFATAVQTEKDLLQCMAYIDLNMVRCGVVEHPKYWPYCGYHELIHPRQRYQIINKQNLLNLTGFQTFKEFSLEQGLLIEALLTRGQVVRNSKWTEHPAVGDDAFLTQFNADRLNIKTR